MYEKILAMEKSMQAEINLLKEREMGLIACMQKDREEIVEEKQQLEQVNLAIFQKKRIVHFAGIMFIRL